MLAPVTKTPAHAAIGLRIRGLRERLGVTKSELKRAAGYEGIGQVTRIEDEGAEPRGVALVQIARRLGTSAEYLVLGEEVAASAPASFHTLSPRADDTAALRELADMCEALGAALTPAELAWLREMPETCQAVDYQTAIKARRAGAAKPAVQSPVRAALAPQPLPRIEAPQVEFAADSGIQVRGPGKRAVSERPAKKRARQS